ncbi:hypothetical protein O3P69_001177 [Scylla paramamosain]|uniref:Uncharacterized protein n=1 Tax=Scylla paramamosain TaxID=85552 RepID=A0AAW0UP24_SCYPA
MAGQTNERSSSVSVVTWGSVSEKFQEQLSAVREGEGGRAQKCNRATSQQSSKPHRGANVLPAWRHGREESLHFFMLMGTPSGAPE